MMDKMLTPSQSRAYDAVVLERLNVCITGPGGSGKSELIRRIVHNCDTYATIGVTSTTGVSACSIGGVTLHSYLGIGLGTASVDDLVKKIKRGKFRGVWLNTDILIIDEISMLSAELFDKIERIGRKLRGNDEPFGGMQVVLFGDFLQLKPVHGKFCFKAKTWDIAIDEVIELKEIMRQSDPEFIELLNSARKGRISREHKELLMRRCGSSASGLPASGLPAGGLSAGGLPAGDLSAKSEVRPTKLFALNANVDRYNDEEYSQLDGPEYIYNINYIAKSNGSNDKSNDKSLIDAIRLPSELKLRVGAQVMHLVNRGSLFNGSRGVVVGFVHGMPLVRFVSGAEYVIQRESLEIEKKGVVVMTYSQVPLKLAYAATIHKAQGMTLDSAEIDFSNIFEAGQFYVALSRVKSLDGLYLKNPDWTLLRADPDALKFYSRL